MSLDSDALARAELAIVVPAYNAASSILPLYRSVIDQELPDGFRMVMIVVDDGSSDKTLEVLEALNHDGRIPVYCVQHDINRGRSSACNSGLDIAVAARYCMLVDADCELSSRYAIGAALRHLVSGVDVVIGRLEPSPDGGAFWCRYQEEVFNRRLTSASPLDESSSALIAFRADAIGGIRFHSEYRHYGFEDRDFFISLRSQCKDSYCIEPKFSARTQIDASLSVMAKKMWACGRYSSSVFAARHPDAYRISRYGQFDLCHISGGAVLALKAGVRARYYLIVIADTWLLASKWIPYWLKRGIAQLVLGLSYFAGTCQREQEVG